jgi:hypothetical protein
MVVSVKESQGKPGQVRFRKTNESEPSMTRRKLVDDIETEDARRPQDELMSSLETE